MYKFKTAESDSIFFVLTVKPVVTYQWMERTESSSTNWRKSFLDNIFPLFFLNTLNYVRFEGWV